MSRRVDLHDRLISLGSHDGLRGGALRHRLLGWDTGTVDRAVAIDIWDQAHRRTPAASVGDGRIGRQGIPPRLRGGLAQPSPCSSRHPGASSRFVTRGDVTGSFAPPPRLGVPRDDDGPRQRVKAAILRPLPPYRLHRLRRDHVRGPLVPWRHLRRADRASRLICYHQCRRFLGINRARSYSCVVAGSAWPTVRCTSSSLAPLANAVVMKVVRIAWEE